MAGAWTPCNTKLPPDGEVMDTVIDEGGMLRNAQKLKRQNGLWFLPDGSMYVYYTPTHWRRP